MKKTYMIPATKVVEIKIHKLLVQYSNSQAAEGATSLSREGRGTWDDED